MGQPRRPRVVIGEGGRILQGAVYKVPVPTQSASEFIYRYGNESLRNTVITRVSDE